MIVSLLGFMGSGKTTTGKKLAKALNFEFVDLDKAIEIAENRTISQIFKEDGEDKFRTIEFQILSIILQNEDNIVLSLGGGTPCFPEAMKLINKHTESFYLNFPEKLLASRLEGGKAKRPLIADLNQEELISFIEHMLNQRNKHYNKAKHVVTDFNNPTKTILEILN